MDRHGHGGVGDGGVGGGHVRDQVRRLRTVIVITVGNVVAGLGEVDLVARPAMAAFSLCRASVSYGETSIVLPGGSPCVVASRQITSRPCSSRVYCWTHTRRRTSTAGI